MPIGNTATCHQLCGFSFSTSISAGVALNPKVRSTFNSVGIIAFVRTCRIGEAVVGSTSLG